MTVEQLIEKLSILPQGMPVADAFGNMIKQVRIDTGTTYKDLIVVLIAEKRDDI